MKSISTSSRVLSTLWRASTYLAGAFAFSSFFALVGGLVGLNRSDVFLSLVMTSGVGLLGSGYVLDLAASPRQRYIRALSEKRNQASDPELHEMRSKADALVVSGVVLLVVGFLAVLGKAT